MADARCTDTAPKSRAPDDPCPNQGRYGYTTHLVVDGICWICKGEEAARRARLEEKGG